jgi:hypothetical protein
VHLNRVRQAAATGSDADRLKAIEPLQHKIHLMTPTKYRLFDKSFWHCHQHQLQDVRTKATGPRSIFPKELALMETDPENKTYRVANMTANMRLQCQIRLSYVETDATTWSLADTEWATIQLEREIYDITSNDQRWLKKAFSICLIEFDAWWENIGIQALPNPIQQCVIHCRYPKMYHASDISESIQLIDSGDHFTPNISEQLLVLAMVPNSLVGSGSCSTQTRTLATGSATWKTRTVGTAPVLPAKPSISSEQFELQLRIWVLIILWHNQYIDCAVLAPDSPIASGLWSDQYSLSRY